MVELSLPDWANRQNALILCLCVIVLGQFGYLWWAARNNPLIRLSDLMTGDNGRLASNKAFQYWAFLISGWAMVFLTVTGDMDAIGWGAWVAIWTGAHLGNKAINNTAAAKAQEISAATGAPAHTPPARD